MQKHEWEQINSQAREWFTLMQSGSVTDIERQQLQDWLRASISHQNAYDQYQMIWEELGLMENTAELAALRASIKPTFFTRVRDFLNDSIELIQQLATPKITGIAFASVALIAFGFIQLSPEKIVITEYATATSQVQEITLPDGSQVTLGAKSHINTWETKSERHVELVDGQAFFKVTKNPQRPFFVNAGDTRVRVVGTQFDVRKGLDRTRVAVVEGIVKVSNDSSPASEPVTLTAGLQVTKLNHGNFEAVNKITVSEVESWRHGRLMYLRASLADVVADANRYLDGSISLGSKNLADLKVTAAVSTDQMNSLTELLSKSLPIVLRKDANNHIEILSPEDAQKSPEK